MRALWAFKVFRKKMSINKCHIKPHLEEIGRNIYIMVRKISSHPNLGFKVNI